MKKQRKLTSAAVVALALTAWYGVAVAQISNIHTVSGQPIMVKKAYDGVEGSPYFTADWRTGAVLYNQERIDDVQLKYDAYEDQVEIIYNNAPFLPDKKQVQGFEFTNLDASGALVNCRFQNGFEGEGISKENYLRVIYEGNNLVLAERIRMEQIKVTPTTYGQREYMEFALTKSFVLVKQGIAERFRPSKKAFMKTFSDIESKLKDFFKANPVDFDNDGDLAKVGAFIDEALVNN